MFVNVSSNGTNVSELYVHIVEHKSDGLDIFSNFVGWGYFLAWSLSFYPQIYVNWTRKSVVGLHFDYVVLNLIGFSLYSLFNVGLYYIPAIRVEYFRRHSGSIIPVKINDMVFAVHGVAATLLTIIQCFIYESDRQRVSTTVRYILVLFGVIILISITLAVFNIIDCLDFLYYCSYVKLMTTLIKYIPQAYLNYIRKSTIGWSIASIFLDIIGGVLSMLQMLIDSYNYNDWVSIFGDPTKFGLGLFSTIFDLLFMFQHYILYRDSNYEKW